MLLRKINAVLSLITTVLLLDHAIFLSVWMLHRCGIAKADNSIPWILVGAMCVHATISIILGILGHKGAEKRKCKEYTKLNLSTIIQRMTGIFMILLLVVHILGAANHFQPKILHTILHPLFFIIVLMHVAVSTSKAFITLGIGNFKVVKVIDIVIKIVCVLTIIAGIIGFYLCLFMGVVR